MKKLLLVGFVGLALLTMAADPYVGYIYPSGIQAGTTNRLIVGGQFFWKIKGVLGGTGVHVHDIELVPGFPPPIPEQRKYLVKWLDGVANGDATQPPLPVNENHFNDWRSNKWYNIIGNLDLGKRTILEHWLYTPRNALQMSPALSQKLLVTVSVDADATPGVREFRVHNPAGMSPPRPLVVTAEPHLPEPLYVPPHRRQPATPIVENIPCVLDGQILPGSTDRWILPLSKGRTITLRVTAREFQPYIGDAVPGFFNPVVRISDKAGTQLAIADDYYHHPDPVLTFTAPGDDEYVLEIHDNLYRGRDDFTYSIDVRDGVLLPSVRELSFSPLPSWEIPKDSLVSEYSGVIDECGKVQSHTLTIAEPCELCFDLLARRAGSPLDARVTVLNGKNELQRVDDVTNTVHVGSVIQAECDPVGRIKFRDPGKYILRVEDEAGRGGDDYFYSLRIHRASPRFEVWCMKSGISLRAWNGGVRLGFKVIRRDGFDGDVKLEENDFFRFQPNVIPASSNEVTVTAISKFNRAVAPTNVTILASGVVNGVHVEVPVVPANEYNQAFAWDHLVPARSFMLIGLPGQKPRRRNGRDGASRQK